MNILEIKELLEAPNKELRDNVIIFSYILDTMYNLYDMKNKNYGDSFGDTWRKLGPISGVTRLYDKLNRIISLIKGDKNNFESLEDTFIDLANYAVMCLVEIQKEKLADLQVDIKAEAKYAQDKFDAEHRVEE